MSVEEEDSLKSSFSFLKRFAEQGEQGMYMQQDASECWNELTRLLMQEVPSKDAEKTDKKFS